MKGLRILTKNEFDIMRVMWDSEKPELWCREVNDLLPEPHPAYTTTATFMRILVDKGFLKKRKFGGVLFYKVVVKEDEYRQFQLKAMLHDLFQDDPMQLVACLKEIRG